ncbi:MAG TPA: hypothetical protein VFE72_02900 [Lysobacter sp.]|nr:hypothetical protein [Lysobacter sp.]
MTTPYVMAPVPNARRRFVQRAEHRPEEVRALLRLLQSMVIGPNGERPSHAAIAGLLGIAERTLGAYCTAPRRRASSPRPVPYVVLYALEVMAANPAAVARELWPETAHAA